MERYQTLLLSSADVSRVIEMAWEDKTPFEAIEFQFGLNQAAVIKLMRVSLKKGSFVVWRKRTHGLLTKHLRLRSPNTGRHQSYDHNKF
ncbi:MAG: TIGR03643 family protein [Methylophilus sp.]